MGPPQAGRIINPTEGPNLTMRSHTNDADLQNTANDIHILIGSWDYKTTTASHSHKQTLKLA